MRNKQMLQVVLVAISLVVANAGNGLAKEYLLKFGAGYVLEKEWNAGSEATETLLHEIERRSNGQIKTKFYGGGQLGHDEKVLVQAQQGLIQMTDASTGHYGPLYPNIQVFDIPYLFLDRQIAWHVINGKTAKAMQEDMAKKIGLRPLVFRENGGFRNYTNNKRPLRTAADLKGLKIRTMMAPLHMQIVKDLGASPTPIPFLELYSALQLGVADGQENAVATFRYPKLEEVQKYMILDGHVFSIMTYLINEKWLRSLPKNLQTAVFQAAQFAAQVNNGISYVQEGKDIEELREMGIDIYDPPLEVKNEFKRMTQKSAIEWLRKQKNIDSKWIDMLLDEVKQVEIELGYSN
jgi:C4-dicarboxylate-binding protein DctP